MCVVVCVCVCDVVCVCCVNRVCLLRLLMLWCVFVSLGVFVVIETVNLLFDFCKPLNFNEELNSRFTTHGLFALSLFGLELLEFPRACSVLYSL